MISASRASLDVGAVDEEMIVRADERRAVVDATEDLPQLVLLDPARARVRSFGVEQERDRRVAVGPVRLFAVAAEHRPQRLRHRRQLGTAGADRARGQQREAEHALGMVERDPLRDRAAHRQADEVRALDAELVEDRDRVGDQVVAGVSRPPGGYVVEPPVSRWS